MIKINEKEAKVGPFKKMIFCFSPLHWPPLNGGWVLFTFKIHQMTSLVINTSTTTVRSDDSFAYYEREIVSCSQYCKTFCPNLAAILANGKASKTH